MKVKFICLARASEEATVSAVYGIVYPNETLATKGLWLKVTVDFEWTVYSENAASKFPSELLGLPQSVENPGFAWLCMR